MITILKSKRGEGYIDVVIIVMSAMLVIALALKVFPVFMEKYQLDTFAAELCRTAEIAGRVGSETSARTQELTEQTGFVPVVQWNASYIPGTKKIRLNGSITVILTYTANIGLFGNFGTFPVQLTSRATGRSEVYWKQ
jgi:hypothetical protein